MSNSIKYAKTHMNGSFKSYISGFLLSVILTIGSFGVVKIHLDSGHVTISDRYIALIIFIFAIMQLAIQLIFFLHLGREQKPYRQSSVFLFTVFIITVLVAGSLWIMANLDYSHGGAHTMSPQQTDAQIIKDEGLQR